MDEALDLWAAIISQTPAPVSPELLSLLPALIPILEDATDSTPQAVQIAESYVLLSPADVLSDRVRFPLLVACQTLLKSTTRQRLGVVPRLVEMMMRGAQTVGDDGGAYHALSQSLVDSEFLSSLVEGLYSAHESSETTGPNRKITPVYGVVETDYYSVLSRLSLGNPQVFVSAVSAVTRTSEEQTLSWILTEWFLHFDNIGSVTQKKLHALGLTQLLSLNAPNAPPPPFVLKHLQSYLTMWTDLATELADGANEVGDANPGCDYLVYWNGKHSELDVGDSTSAVDPPEIKRKRAWSDSDIVHQVNIRGFVRETLHSLIVRCGGEHQFQENWLGNVDREVVEAFGALGIL